MKRAKLLREKVYENQIKEVVVKRVRVLFFGFICIFSLFFFNTANGEDYGLGPSGRIGVALHSEIEGIGLEANYRSDDTAGALGLEGIYYFAGNSYNSKLDDKDIELEFDSALELNLLWYLGYHPNSPYIGGGLLQLKGSGRDLKGKDIDGTILTPQIVIGFTGCKKNIFFNAKIGYLFDRKWDYTEGKGDSRLNPLYLLGSIGISF